MVTKLAFYGKVKYILREEFFITTSSAVISFNWRQFTRLASLHLKHCEQFGYNGRNLVRLLYI